MRYVLIFLLGVGVGVADIVYTVNLDPQNLVIKERNGYISISYGEYPKPYPAGKPNLPVVPMNFLLPFGEKAVSLSYEIISSEIVATGLPEYVIPEVPPGSSPPENIKPDPSIYDGAQPFPEVPVRLVGTEHMGGYPIAGIEVNPVIFYPNTRQILFIDKIRVTIRTTSGEPGIYPMRAYMNSQEKIRKIVKSIVVNPEIEPASRPPTQFVDYREFVNAQNGSNIDEPTLTTGPYEYLIITDSSLVEPFQVYADWQIYQGRPAIVVTMQWIRNHYQGVDDAERMRNFIQDAYRFWGISWLLLGGDSPLVPTRHFYQEVYYGGPDDDYPPSDFYFVCLDGNWNKDGDMNFGEVEDRPDPLPEVFHGRVPVGNIEEAWNFVNKSISYVTEPGGDSTGLNAEYVSRVLALGTDLWGAYLGPYYAELAVSRLPKYLQIYRMYEDSTHNNTLEEFLNYLDWGMGIVHINAHATYNFFSINYNTPHIPFGIPEVGLLNNKGVLPFVFLTGCNASGWDYVSVMEEFIKVQNTGAVAVLGVTRLDYPSSELAYTYLHFDTLFFGFNHPIGGMMYAITEYWTLTYQNSPYRYLYLSKVLLGDPALNLWTKPPRFFDLDYPTTVHPGLNTYTFTVTERGTGEPVSDAKVIVYKEGEVYEQGQTDRQGKVTLSFMPQTDGKIYFSVVRNGFVPIRYNVNVQPGGMYARIQNITFNDSTGYGGDGDGDGIPEAGESVLLRVTVENTGATPLLDIFVRMISLSGDIIVTSDSGRITGLAPGSSTVLSNDFRFHVIPSAEESYHKLVFLFSGPPAFSTSDPLIPPALWSDTVEVWVQNARVVFTRIYRQIRGDTLLLWPEIVNLGQDIADSINIYVSDLQGVYEAIDTTYDIIPQVMPGEVYFDTTDSPIILTGNTTLLQSISETWYLTEERGYHTSIYHKNKNINPPEISVTPTQGGLLVTWNSIGDGSRYIVFKRDGQQMLRLVREPIQHALYSDVPLPPGSKGTYWVIGIDSLYNSTVLSDSGVGFVSPPLRSGWPQPYNSSGSEESHHPIVVDFDPTYPGKEIIFGTYLGQIYAFHSDGTYVPGWPIQIDGEVWGAVAAGDIDNDGINEIVVVPRNGEQHPNRVYAFEYDGSNVTGWPQDFSGGSELGNSGSYAHPTIVDLDGDGTLEVLVHGMKGKIYAWHGDGSSYIPGANGYFGSGGHGGWNYSNLAIGDIDNDGENEVVVGTNTADSSIIVYDIYGNMESGFPLALGKRVISGIAIGDIYPSSPGLEIVFVSKDRKLYVVSSSGNILPGWPKPVTVAGDASYTLPSISDIDNDGTPDILVNENTRISIYNATGTLLDTLPFYEAMVQNFSQVVTADIDNDGTLEVFSNHLLGGVYAWKNGEILPGFPITIPEQIKATPVIADLDYDGIPELIVLSISNVYAYQLSTQWDSTASAWPVIAHDVGHTSNFNATYLPINPQIMGKAGVLIHDFISRPYPNPASNKVTITFGLSSQGKASLSVYNSSGRRIALLVNRVLTRGFYTATWNTTGIPSGVYFLRLETPKLQKSHRVVVTH